MESTDPWRLRMSASRETVEENATAVSNTKLPDIFQRVLQLVRSDNGIISLEAVDTLFRFGGVGDDTAQAIMDFAIVNKDHISNDDVILVLKLIAVAQRGAPLSLDTITSDPSPDAWIPQLNGVESATWIGKEVRDRSNTWSNIVSNDEAALADAVAQMAKLRSNDATPATQTQSVTNADPWRGRASSNDVAASVEAVLRQSTSPPTDDTLVLTEDDPMLALRWYLAMDRVDVKLDSELVGTVFKHANYTVSSQSHRSSVKRRYSDFVALQEILQKRHPHRLIPPLPPKKIAAVSDQVFMELRRRGLVRFINAIARHLILKTDPVTVAFLTDPEDSWKRVTPMSSEEEAHLRGASSPVSNYQSANTSSWSVETKQLLLDDVSTLDASPALLRQLQLLKTRLPIMRQFYEEFVKVIECMVQRLEEEATGTLRLSLLWRHIATGQPLNDAAELPLQSSKTSSYTCWLPSPCDPCLNIANGFSDASHSLRAISTLYNEQSLLDSSEVLEPIRGYLDLIVAFQEAFDRMEKSLILDFEPHQKRIQALQSKLEKAGAQPQTSLNTDRLITQIDQEQKDMALHRRRLGHARRLLWEEAIHLHRHRAFVSLALQKYVDQIAKFTGLRHDVWLRLQPKLESLPIHGQ